MRIAQVSPLYESCPPRLYGGTERVVSHLTEELVRQGHEVTLFASGDSRTAAVLRSPCATALRLNPQCHDPIFYHLIQMHRIASCADQFDIIHFHADFLQFPLFAPLLAQDRDDVARAARSAGPAAADARIFDDAVGFDLERAARAAALGQLVRHHSSWAAARTLPAGPRCGRLSRLHRPHQSGKAAGPCDRDRPARRGAADHRRQGRQGRWRVLQNRDRAAARQSADRVHRRNRRRREEVPSWGMRWRCCFRSIGPSRSGSP